MFRLSYRQCWNYTGNLIRHISFTTNVLPTKKSVEQRNDDFTEEFLANRIQLSTIQKLVLSAGSSVAAILDPKRGDMIACLGETTGEDALLKLLRLMRSSEEGLEILSEKPRINSKTVHLDALASLPDDTFGNLYYQFLKENVPITLFFLFVIRPNFFLLFLRTSHRTHVSQSDL